MRGPKYDREFLVNKVAMMRIKGKSTYSILEFLKEDLGLAQTTSYEILRDAQKVFVEIQKQKLEGAFEEAIAQLEELYDSTSDKKLKLSIRQELNKMIGLYAAQKVEHSGGVQFSGIDIQIVTGTESNDTKNNDEPNGNESV